jgi:hypothetical protein
MVDGAGEIPSLTQLRSVRDPLAAAVIQSPCFRFWPPCTCPPNPRQHFADESAEKDMGRDPQRVSGTVVS